MARRAETYDRAFVRLRELVNDWDPIGLISMGCPEDEYDPEIAVLVRLVLGAGPIDQTAVDGVWIRWFGDSYRQEESAESLAFTARLMRLRTELLNG
jgi:hypothetical protein